MTIFYHQCEDFLTRSSVWVLSGFTFPALIYYKVSYPSAIVRPSIWTEHLGERHFRGNSGWKTLSSLQGKKKYFKIILQHPNYQPDGRAKQKLSGTCKDGEHLLLMYISLKKKIILDILAKKIKKS